MTIPNSVPTSLDSIIDSAISEVSGLSMPPAPGDPASGSIVDEAMTEAGFNDSDVTPDDDDGAPDEGLEEAADGEDEVEPAPNPDEEDIQVTDENGTRMLKVNYKDKDAIRRAHQQAAGGRKLHSAYKRLKSELAEYKAKGEATQSEVQAWQKMEDLYESGGIAALIRQVEEKDPVEVAKAILAQHEQESKLSPEQRVSQQRQAELSQRDRELADLKKQIADMNTKISANQTESKLSALQSNVNEEFAKVRFSGKLSNATQAEKLDKMMWNHIQLELAAAEEAGNPLDRQTLARVIQEASSLIPEVIHQEARKVATKTASKTSQAAAKGAQAAVVANTAKTRASTKAPNEMNWLDSSSVLDFAEQALSKRR